MDATLTHRTHATNNGGTFTVVHGVVHYEGWEWRVSTTISQWSDCHWHVGQEADPEKYRVRHFSASKIGGGKLTALATIPETRALMRIVEAALAAGEVTPAPPTTDCWSHLVPAVPQVQIEAYAPAAAITTQAAPVLRRLRTTMANQCSIYRKYGLGERCTGTAVEGDERGRCKLHVHLESLCGPLPTAKGDFRPARLKKAKQVVDAGVGVEAATVPAVAIPDGAVARITPDALAEAVAAAPAPSTPTQKPKKHVKKSAKKGASPKA